MDHFAGILSIFNRLNNLNLMIFMKRILPAIALLLAIPSYSQNTRPDAQTVVADLKQKFVKVKPGKFSDLVPFAGNGKWGFIDRNTKKVLVEPAFISPFFFYPGTNIDYNDTEIDISASGEITAVPEKPIVMMEEAVPGGMYDYDPKVKHSSDGFVGFTVNYFGELAYYSDLYQYNKQGIPGWNIQVVKFQDRYLGVVKNLQGKSGIIEQNGTPVKGFDFNFSDIHPNRGCLDSARAWFYVKKNETDNYSLMNLDGEVKPAIEIVGYPLLSSERFGYTPYNNGDTSSLFDNYLMTWVVKPQTRLKIYGMYFSSDIPLRDHAPANRDKVHLYYLVFDGTRSYFMDLKGVKYLPKK